MIRGFWSLVTLAALPLLSACQTSTQGPQMSSYQNAMAYYQPLDCQQLRTEMQFLQMQLGSPPPSYPTGGGVYGSYMAGAAAGQAAAMQGRMEALRQNMVAKRC